ncbi:MAG: DNA polymerase Y family protein [Rhodocyclales bacterium GT-UBC]|nr:MAG: DNA polymerase Y family protein [Rhodocyclales bacterium GT-UBC]
MLWLALHFPLLPLEALPLRQSPSAVVSRGRVLCCDTLAARAGVRDGQRLSTALGLQPGLAVFERDTQLECRALESLACWAGRFTPTVSVSEPATLLLEIAGCQRLFGGLEAIVDVVQAGCAAQSYSIGWAVAPTPLAAEWLARAGAGQVLRDIPQMRQALAGLSCAVPDWGRDAQARLDAFGLSRLGDLRALPSAGLRQRIGPLALDALLRAWGEMPDPRRNFVFPEQFAQKLELPARIEQAEALVFAGQRLFSAFAGWLQGRQLLVRVCRLQLTHDDASQTDLPLRFAEPAADEGRFVRLLREHLGRLLLRAPVEAIALLADELQPSSGTTASLFEQPRQGEGTLVCLERLQARLGGAAVQVLGAKADYRPECASSGHAPNAMVSAGDPSLTGLPGGAQRPLWLLPVPQALIERHGCPYWHGALKLLSRGERLESGWWDEGEAALSGGDAVSDNKTGKPAGIGDVRRDYFVARNPLGQWAWVFRDAEGWFLHGLFA